MNKAIYIIVCAALLAGLASGTVTSPYSDRTCTLTECTENIYGYQKYINCNGDWKEVKNDIKVKLDKDNILTIQSCHDTARYQIFLEDDVNGRYFMDSLSESMKLKTKVQVTEAKLDGGIKFNISFPKLPVNTRIVGFEPVDSIEKKAGLVHKKGDMQIDWSDIQKTGNKLNKDDSSELSFTDLNITGTSLILDPTVTLTGSTLINDTYINQHSPNTNYVTDAALYLESNAGQQDYIYIGIKNNVTTPAFVTNAVLYLYQVSTDAGTASAYNTTCTNYNASNLTWNANPCTTGLNISKRTLPASVGWNYWNITLALQQQQNPIILVEPTGTAHSTFRSNEAGSTPPYVSLTYTITWNYTHLNISDKNEAEAFSAGTFVTSDYTNVSAVYIVHNGTLHATAATAGTYAGVAGTWYEVNLTAPNLAAGYTNSTVNYTWSLMHTDGSFTNTTGLYYTIYEVNFSPGNSSSTGNLEFWIFDEDSPLMSIPADLEIFLQIGSLNFSYNYTNQTNMSFVLTTNATVGVDVYIKYNGSGYEKNRYYLNDVQMSNASAHNYSIYNLVTGTSDLKLTVRNKNTYEYYPNIYVRLLRQYLGENLWRTVQMGKSDTFGAVNFNIRESTTDYMLMFYDDDNHLLETSNSMSLLCTAGLCELTYLVEPYSGAVFQENISVSASFNNVTDIVTITWFSPAGNSQTFRSVVWKDQPGNRLVICDQNSTGVGGTQTCNISGVQGNVLVNGYVVGSMIPVFHQIINNAAERLSDVLSIPERGLWTVGIVLCCAAFGLYSPVAGAIATVAGLVLVYFLGINSGITLVFIIVVGFMAMLIGLRVKY